MKYSIAALALALAPALGYTGSSDELAEWSLREHFKAFETKFAKIYETAEKKEERFEIFVKNLETVVMKNQALREKGEDEVHGITKFSDMTNEEFKATMFGGHDHSKNDRRARGVAVPNKLRPQSSSFDWRDQGVITPVKDQGRCGSCWAHSAVETVESALAIAGHDLTPLSVQQVVSCDNGNGDLGCSGGWYYTAWEDYMEPSKGLTTEAEYPYDTATYNGQASACDTSKASDVVAGTTPSNWTYATTPCQSAFCKDQDEDTLKANLLSYGPISVACDASEWSFYTGGVVTSTTCGNSGFKLDHAIQLVGFNEDADTPYWIVRNSWDTTWGNEGYIYLKMGENTCGVADMPALVNLQKA